MAEKKAKVYNYAAASISGFVNDDYVVSNISLGADEVPGTDAAGEPFDGTKFSVGVKRFKISEFDSISDLDAAVRERFAADDETDVGLQYALDGFLTQIMTRPNYKASAKEAIEAGDYEEAHRIAQDLLDNYRVGRRKAVGPTMKAKVAKLSALENKAQELGITYEELIERAMSA